jgi:ATP-binding cassette, subfamily B, heavy metal transporter
VPAGQKRWRWSGPSGSGKSTIGRLLFRFYDVTGGRDPDRRAGHARGDADSLHAQIGVVPQDTVLFNDTIATTSPMAGRRDAAEVEAAARAAKIHDFIAACPKAMRPRWASAG